jgi:hypothetical protein
MSRRHTGYGSGSHAGAYGGASYGSGSGGRRQQYAGVTQSQFDYLQATQPGFVAASSRIGTYDNPMQNVADRNWQEVLRGDRGYTWGAADQASWKKNCSFGPHNASDALDAALYGKK